MENLGVYTWGDNTYGQCFVDPEKVVCVREPLKVEGFSSFRRSPRAGNACGDFSWLINQTGAVYASGDNHKNFISTNEPESTKLTSGLVDHPELQLHNIVAISSGKDHAVAVTENGVAISWGRSNEFGQLGHLGEPSINPSPPRMIQGLKGISVVSVACGENFTLLLTEEGKIYSCGANQQGQLGLGHFNDSSAAQQISAGQAHGVAFRKIAAGANHAVAISISGTVYTWGSTKFGKCGPSSGAALPSPTPLSLDRPATHIACGAEHSVVVAGDVFCYGDNRHGQCGKGDRLVMPAKISSVTAGANHTLAMLADGRVFGWGDNSVGQLGLESTENFSIPTQLSISGALFVAAGSFHSVAVCSSTGETTLERSATFRPAVTPQADDDALPVALSQGSVDRLSFKFNASLFPQAGSHPAGSFAALSVARLVSLSAEPRQLERAMTKAFDDAVILGASLLIPRLRRPQLDAEAAATALRSVQSGILTQIENVAAKLLLRMSATAYELRNPDQLRFLLPLLLLPLKPREGSLCQNLGLFVSRLRPTGRELFMELLHAQLSSHTVLLPALDAIRIQAEQSLTAFAMTATEEPLPLHICSGLMLLQMLRLPTVDARRYELAALGGLNHQQLTRLMQREVRGWRMFFEERGKLPDLTDLIEGDLFSDDRLRFLLSFAASLPVLFKQDILTLDNMLRQAAAEEQLFKNQPARLFAMLLQGVRPVAAHVLSIRRDFIVADATRQLGMAAPAQLRLPLKVAFVGEEGIDEGGVAREFFSLLGRNLFNPDFGMFSQNAESRVLWFSPAAAAEGSAHSEFFEVVGRLFGLAVYNNLPGLSAPFPLALFRHLRGEVPTLADAAEIFPEQTRSFRAILEWTDAENFEETFSVDFATSFDFYGENRVVDLVPSGRNIPVTFKSRQEFVDLYVDWLLAKSVAGPIKSVTAGFAAVAGSGLALAAFSAEDLRTLICGEGGEIDFADLQINVKYEGGFTASDPYIVEFWKVLNSLEESQKRRFLIFVTGSDRLPLGGLSAMSLKIQENGVEPTDHLPTAYTCYSVLLLPRYASPQKLKRLLLTAVENAEGFGLR